MVLYKKVISITLDHEHFFIVIVFIIVVIVIKQIVVKNSTRTFGQNFLYCDTCLSDTKDLANKIICIFCKYLLIFRFDFFKDFLHRSLFASSWSDRKSLQILIRYFFFQFSLFLIEIYIYRQLSHVRLLFVCSVCLYDEIFFFFSSRLIQH